jgi:hypothetical protein
MAQKTQSGKAVPFGDNIDIARHFEGKMTRKPLNFDLKKEFHAKSKMLNNF